MATKTVRSAAAQLAITLLLLRLPNLPIGLFLRLSTLFPGEGQEQPSGGPGEAGGVGRGVGVKGTAQALGDGQRESLPFLSSESLSGPLPVHIFSSHSAVQSCLGEAV